MGSRELKVRNQHVRLSERRGSWARRRVSAKALRKEPGGSVSEAERESRRGGLKGCVRPTHFRTYERL